VFRGAVVSLALFCFCAWIAAEASQTSSASSANASPPAVTVTGEDNGKDIDLTAGGTLIVKLKSNPSTGYAWTVSGDPAPLRLQKSKYVKNTQSSKTAGAPGMQVLWLSASSAGMTTLTVVYRRSWEYNVPPVKVFNLRVNVR
jgi:inhibitor of cysteine peptidase